MHQCDEEEEGEGDRERSTIGQAAKMNQKIRKTFGVWVLVSVLVPDTGCDVQATAVM